MTRCRARLGDPAGLRRDPLASRDRQYQGWMVLLFAGTRISPLRPAIKSVEGPTTYAITAALTTSKISAILASSSAFAQDLKPFSRPAIC